MSKPPTAAVRCMRRERRTKRDFVHAIADEFPLELFEKDDTALLEWFATRLECSLGAARLAGRWFIEELARENVRCRVMRHHHWAGDRCTVCGINVWG
jgi:hypothetical protein